MILIAYGNIRLNIRNNVSKSEYRWSNTATININPKTGKFDANLLPENVKSGIRDLTAAIGAVVGSTVGDSASNAQLAGVIAEGGGE